MNNETLKRFQEKIQLDIITGCWNWTGFRNSDGYGGFCNNGISQGAHRIAYEHWNGDIPKGLQIDHLCRNRSCVNPAHLEIVTLQENVRRGETGKYNKDKTHCKHGHKFTLENTRITKVTERVCRTCCRLWQREHYIKKLEVK